MKIKASSITDDFLDTVYNAVDNACDVGVGCGAWDMVDEKEIIAAVINSVWGGAGNPAWAGRGCFAEPQGDELDANDRLIRIIEAVDAADRRKLVSAIHDLSDWLESGGPMPDKA